MSRPDAYHFVCPECAQRIEINDSMREALLENGCVICGAPLSDEDFSSVDGDVEG